MMPCLQVMINRVAELHQAGLRACHCAEEFTLRRILPLGRQEKLAYECSWFANPNREPVDGKILTSFATNIELIFRYDNIKFQLMSYMFDKSPPTERPNSVPAPFYSENPPPEVGILSPLI
jgi:hypothetical protein